MDKGEAFLCRQWLALPVPGRIPSPLHEAARGSHFDLMADDMVLLATSAQTLSLMIEELTCALTAPGCKVELQTLGI